ncbi:hypothetical protein SPRG_05328 [Saprolegnia parasitica CBS 223.65]|uniref:Palmitoyltransferase n=1 Tax=Saprolegnia parasitica (strain CBS 223.65) TaxID=695850 RepID=A0A067CUD6_SAPPC|nr:hypothetical protein SPRG_05328 [Saprolegnia parasitica CBS 223.65]KDO30136.1 hypothetical protein SPRG_05328 [Saprolegnia parasitica CBS 223.65]|eukprot:XP_012199314.1 hypothetical protein SPRG_05328 [Saprolegnia parasitica CBS 223.65]
MWFVTDGGFVVTLLGVALMLAGVGLCLSNMHEWLGASMASGILASGLLVLSVLTASAHWYTMTTNPGTVPKYVHVLSTPASDDTDAEHVPLHDEDTTLHCDICDAARPRCVTHCDSCQGCITMMDHHCPWVNNCVGIGNLKNFVLLLIYLFLTCAYMGSMTVAQIASCPETCGLDDGKQPGKAGVAVMAVAFIFGALAAIMLILEVFSIHYDERIKWIVQKTQDRRVKRATLTQKLGVLFGSQTFRWHWLLPGRDVHRHRSSTDMDIILGYRPLFHES